MKYIVLAALLASAVSSVKITSLDNGTNKWATGASGDEDLGQDITMKGDKFHYNEGAHAASAGGDEGTADASDSTTTKQKIDPESLPLCNGTNGVPGEDCRAPSQKRKSTKKKKSLHEVSGSKDNEIPTCTERITTNCQPVCTETLTTGCTEARAPQPPMRDRYEGGRTFR